MRLARLLLLVLPVAAAPAVAGCGGGARPASLAAGAATARARTPPLPPLPRTGPFAPGTLMSDVTWLTAPARAGRGAYQPGGAQTAAWIAARFRTLGLEVIRQPIAGAAENVIGIRRAGPRALVVSAHYDHLGRKRGVVYPGADDNASGTAVLLALAAYHAQRNYEHTLVFIAFGAEEVGLIGSRLYVRRPAWPIENTVGIVNFDMVGRRFFEAGADRNHACAIIGLEQDEATRAAAIRAGKRAGLSIVPIPARLAVVFGEDYRTDEWWFRRRGILAVHFTTGYHHDYHRPTDTADKIVPSQLSRVAQTAAGVVSHLAIERPSPAIGPARGAAAGSRVRSGSAPRRARSGPG